MPRRCKGGMSEAYSADSEKDAGKAFQPDQLVEQAQAGDHLAFHRLADHYQPEIFRMIYYRTWSRMDAEDLTQDVFLRAYKHIGRLEAPGLFRSWLYRMLSIGFGITIAGRKSSLSSGGSPWMKRRFRRVKRWLWHQRPQSGWIARISDARGEDDGLPLSQGEERLSC